MPMPAASDREILAALFDAALSAALPDGRFAGRLPEPPRGRTIVLGAGKGAARMASAFEKAWSEAGNGPLEGLVVTRYGHATATQSIEVVEENRTRGDGPRQMASPCSMWKCVIPGKSVSSIGSRAFGL